MYFFLKKISLFFALTFASYFFIGIIFEKIIKKNLTNNQFQFQEDWHMKHPHSFEFLFIGNSRTWAQVDIDLMTKKQHEKSFCLAQDGRDSRILFYKLKKYLELNEHPKHIFLQFDPYFISENNDGTFYGKKNYLGYMYQDWLGINSIFENEIGFDRLEVFFPLKRYFSTIGGIPILYYHLTNTRPSDYSTFKYGSVPQNRRWSPSSKWSQPDRTNCLLNFKYIDAIVSICKAKRISLTLFYPPQSFLSYQLVDHHLIKELSAYASKNNLTYWNFNAIKYDNIQLFYNHTHLNTQGSNVFTIDFLDSINKIR